MKKRVISTLLCATMLVGMITGCGSNNTESAGNTSSNAASTESGDGEKVVLNVINYHVGTDYAADYYSYLFDAFQQTEEGKNVEFKFEEIPTTDAYNQKIKLLISSGDLPDIVFNGGNNITALAAEAGKVTDLTLMREKYMVFLFQRKFPIFTITKICLLKLVWRHRTLHMRHGMNSLMHVTL